MDPKDINFTIKTGQSIDNQETEIDIVEILSIITTFAENSLQSAAIYVEHANRKVITKTDIKLAMQWEVFMYLNRDNSKKLLKNYNSIKKDLDNIDKNEKDNLEDIIEKEDEYCIFTKSDCNCDICFNINDINKKWCNWIPKTPIEEIFKKNIDLM